MGAVDFELTKGIEKQWHRLWHRGVPNERGVQHVDKPNQS